MNLLDTLTRAADEEQLRLKPLPEHAAATQEEHLRRHYALLLAAVLTAQPTISEPQTRLLRLLLDALKLGDIRGPLFEQTRELEPETLLEAARLIREAGFAHHLVVDALVLLRLDARLGDEAARLAGELATFLGLDEAELATRAKDAADILGLNAGHEKIAPSAASKEDDRDDGKEDITAEAPLQLAELWPAYLSQPLTAEALRVGLQGGLWLLDADLYSDFPWQANDAVLHFRNGAMLNTIAKEGEIKLTDCRVHNAVLHFTGACSVTLDRCDWRGNYDPGAHRTALKSQGPALTMTDCQFATRNARAISVQDAKLTVTGSRFTDCGHAELNGGALWHSDHGRLVENCRFDRCLASYGGALYCNSLYGVDQCEFVACESRSLQKKDAGDIAVYASTNSASVVVERCVFRHTSINVGNSYSFSGRQIALACQFIQGNLYFTKNCQKMGPNSTFDGGRMIDWEI